MRLKSQLAYYVYHQHLSAEKITVIRRIIQCSSYNPHLRGDLFVTERRYRQSHSTNTEDLGQENTENKQKRIKEDPTQQHKTQDKNDKLELEFKNFRLEYS